MFIYVYTYIYKHIYMFIRSGLKTQYQGNKGKLGLFIGNKRHEQLSGFELVFGVQSPELACMCSSAGTTIAPRQQMQLTATVECHAPFLASPPLTVKFVIGGERRVMNLRLPVVAAKFVEPLPLSQTEFDAAWDSCVFAGTGVDEPMVMMDKWMKPETLKAMISNGLHFALLGAGDGPLMASGRLQGGQGTYLCYLKVQVNQLDKTVTVSVRADNGPLRDSMDELLKLLLTPAR